MEEHDVVKLHYVGREQRTGEIFDLTDPDVAEDEDLDTAQMDLGPVTAFIGEDYVIEGLDEALRDLEVGDETTVEVPKEKAFGSRKSENIRTVSENEFDEHDVRPRRGMPVEIDGQRGKILTVSNGRVKVDFNHPLAGKDLEYEVEVLERIEDPVDQIGAILDFHIDASYDIGVEDGSATVSIHADLPEEVQDRIEDELEKLEDIDDVTVEASEEGGDSESEQE